MSPKLHLGKDTCISRSHLSYTRKQIMEEYHPELWNKAQVIAGNLLNLQEKVIKLLPEAKRLLPSQVEALKDEEAQAIFLNYIRLRALYAFAEKLWNVIEDQCRKLAEAQNKDNRYDLEDAKEALEKTLEKASMLSFEELLKEKDLNYLYEQKTLLGIYDFPVFKFSTYSWSFRDIVDPLNNCGFGHEGLLKDANADEYPTTPSCGPLLNDD